MTVTATNSLPEEWAISDEVIALRVWGRPGVPAVPGPPRDAHHRDRGDLRDPPLVLCGEHDLVPLAEELLAHRGTRRRAADRGWRRARERRDAGSINTAAALLGIAHVGLPVIGEMQIANVGRSLACSATSTAGQRFEGRRPLTGDVRAPGISRCTTVC